MAFPLTVRDQAVINLVGATIPAGSTVTFRFFTAGNCAGPFTTATVPVTAGVSSITVFSPDFTISGPGTYSFNATFNSGNPAIVASSTSGCEPVVLTPAPPGPPPPPLPIPIDFRIVAEFIL